jgi:hypothetical protein
MEILDGGPGWGSSLGVLDIEDASEGFSIFKFEESLLRALRHALIRTPSQRCIECRA